jgi:alpha-D-ribose 1-methylphosphonate 5-triphosphate synthase subunit PhnH
MSAAPAAQRLSPLTSQAVFRVLLGSLAQPGRVFQLPEAVAWPETGPEGAPLIGPGIVPLALAVIGSKIAVAGAPEWEARICQATGAVAADIAEAALAALYQPTDPALIWQLRRGSAGAPEDGAKVGLGCDTLIANGPGEVTLELSGPGVPGHIRLGVDGVSSDTFDALRAVNTAFPAGVDAWLVDMRGQIAGLPRSTRQVVV